MSGYMTLESDLSQKLINLYNKDQTTSLQVSSLQTGLFNISITILLHLHTVLYEHAAYFPKTQYIYTCNYLFMPVHILYIFISVYKLFSLRIHLLHYCTTCLQFIRFTVSVHLSTTVFYSVLFLCFSCSTILRLIF